MPTVPSTHDRLIDLMGGTEPPEPLEIVDVGANPIDGEPPYAPLLTAGVARVTGFEPQPSAYEELQALADEAHRYLPYAVGDGAEHDLFVCEQSGFTSMLEPDPDQLALLTDFPRMAQVVGRHRMGTQRLDDIAELDRMDLLKIDIQGGEREVFEHGRRLLAGTVAVQTEVNFFRLYRGQPTFADVDLELRAQGFVPHAFVATKTWPLAPVQWADPFQEQAHQLVEADVLYVRDPAHARDLTGAQLRRLGLIAHLAYASCGLTLLCVRELVRRGELPQRAAEEYAASLAVA